MLKGNLFPGAWDDTGVLLLTGRQATFLLLPLFQEHMEGRNSRQKMKHRHMCGKPAQETQGFFDVVKHGHLLRTASAGAHRPGRRTPRHEACAQACSQQPHPSVGHRVQRSQSSQGWGGRGQELDG